MRTLVAVLAFMLVCSTARSADLDAIEADICNKWEKIKSMTYDMESTTNMSTPQFSMSSSSTGSAEMKRKSDLVWLMRMDSKSNTVQTVAGNETKSQGSSLMVIDGDYIYTLSDYSGQKMCTKAKALEYNKMAGGKNFFKWLREEHDVKVLPDETVDGVSCYAIQATPKKQLPNQGSMKFCFSKDNGITVLTQAFTPEGKVLTSSKMKNIKMDVSLADDHFTFTAPAGVQVIDSDAAAAGARAQKEEAPAKSEPAKTETAETKDDKKDTAEKKDDPKKDDTKKDDTKKDEPKKKRKLPGF